MTRYSPVSEARSNRFRTLFFVSAFGIVLGTAPAPARSRERYQRRLRKRVCETDWTALLRPGNIVSYRLLSLGWVPTHKLRLRRLPITIAAIPIPARVIEAGSGTEIGIASCRERV